MSQMAAKEKTPFGGYSISFKGQTATLEQVFGTGALTPPEMTKKLWAHVKAHKLSTTK